MGHLQVRATFDPTWDSAPGVGLTLKAQRGGEYRFLVGETGPAPAATGSPGKSPPLRAVRKTHGQMRVQILRDRVKLREVPIPVPEGTLQLEAGRVGERVSMGVNRQRLLTFEDPFPVGVDQPVRVGVYWPSGVGLVELTVEHQALPPEPSALERGDDLVSQGRYGEALEEYESQARKSVGSEAETETSFKQALCLNRLGRQEEAIRLLEGLTGKLSSPQEATERWCLRGVPALADRAETRESRQGREYPEPALHGLFLRAARVARARRGPRDDPLPVRRHVGRQLVQRGLWVDGPGC